MKKVCLCLVTLICMSWVAFAIDVSEDKDWIVIKTKLYEAWWRKAARMGYMQVFVEGGNDSLIGRAFRAFYHSSNYGPGWSDWGALQKWEIVEKKSGKVVIKYISRDKNGSKEYTCIATYWDSVPYIKHEVTIKNVGNTPVTSWEDCHEPMLEPNVDFKGMKAWDTPPVRHVAYWTKDGFVGLYSEMADKAAAVGWGGKNPGRIHLCHNALGQELKKGKVSDKIVYYVAFGKGGEKEANALAGEVIKEPPEASVDPDQKLTTTWGAVKEF